MPPPSLLPVRTPPPWEVVLLLSHRLDPKTLALASCVSRSWNAAMSSDDLWRPICHSHFPSLSSLLHPTTAASLSPYCTLFVLLRNASARRRRDPPPPRVALRQLIFAVDVFHGDAPVLSVVKRGGDLERFGDDAIFRFDMRDQGAGELEVEPAAGLRAVWAVVGDQGREGAAVLMDCRGKGRLMGVGSEVWFSEELPPPPRCCSGATASGLVAELGLGLGPRVGGAGAGGEEREARRRVVRVSVGLMEVASWRYVQVEDGLRYLQHFFSCGSPPLQY